MHLSLEARLNLCLLYDFNKWGYLIVIGLIRLATHFDLCHTKLYGIDYWQWYKIIASPFLDLLVWNYLRWIVFENNDQKDSQKMRFIRLLHKFTLSYELYQQGMHNGGNALEILSRWIGQPDGERYEAIRWIDEHYTHFIKTEYCRNTLWFIYLYVDGVRTSSQKWAVIVGVLFGAAEVFNMSEAGLLFCLPLEIIIFLMFIYYRYKVVCKGQIETAVQDYFTIWGSLIVINIILYGIIFLGLLGTTQPSEGGDLRQLYMLVLWFTYCPTVVPVTVCIHRRIVAKILAKKSIRQNQNEEKKGDEEVILESL